MKMNFFVSTTVLLVCASALAQTPKIYSCQALDGNQSGLGGISNGNDKVEAEIKFLELVKQYGVTKVSCSTLPKQGELSDLGGKKWVFQGLNSNETYLVFQGNQLLYIQECGKGRLVQKFNTEVVGNKSLKLTEAGSEGSCNPYYVAGFETGSIISVQIMISEDQASTLLIKDQRHGETTSTTSFYREMFESRRR